MNKYQEAYEIIFDDLVPMPELNERNRDWLFQCMDIIQQAVVKANKYDELTKTPTPEEVKKEWVELGYSWLECDPMFIRLENKLSNSYIVINKFSKTYKCFGNRDYTGNYLTMPEHNLLTKTFRVLGREIEDE